MNTIREFNEYNIFNRSDGYKGFSLTTQANWVCGFAKKLEFPFDLRKHQILIHTEYGTPKDGKMCWLVKFSLKLHGQWNEWDCIFLALSLLVDK